jgi:hypothetical protein
MLKTVIDYPMDEERMVVRQNLKGYEKVNQVVSVEFYGHKKRFAKYTWMKNRTS